MSICRSPVARRLGIGLLSIGLVACSSAGGSSRPASAPATSTTIASAAHASTAPTVATAAIAWSQLRNPIVSSPTHVVKDPALVAVGATWFMAFSAEDSRGTWRIGIEHSLDLRTWSPLTFMPHDPSVEGEASPDIVRAPDGRFVITYQSFVHDVGNGLAKLYYRTTSDFVHFSAAHLLLQPRFRAASDRLIDAALAWTPAGLLLGFKTGNTDATQAFEIARSTSGALAGPWQVIGKPDIRVYGDTIENYQFIPINGRWMLLATSNQLDQPFVFQLAGNPDRASGWLRWSAGRRLVVPQEAWNTGTGITGSTYEHANCAYVVDRKSVDGYYYLVYEDTPELTSFGGEGHGRLSIARSTNLVHWSVPPG